MIEVNDNILNNVTNIHFVGIGGAGMCPLAEILFSKNYIITGSDINETDTLKRIRDMGIKVHMGHNPENINNAHLVVYTSAVNMSNPELIAAVNNNIPVIERSVLLGMVSRKFENSIAIAGTHGKTTTTSMISQILIGAKKDPTIVIGGKLPLTGTNGRAGNSNLFVCEACEYVDTFLQLTPSVSVILNIDADHLDYFGTISKIIESFRNFAKKTSDTLIINGDDLNTTHAVEDLDHNIITFGLNSYNDFYAENISEFDGAYNEFDVIHNDETVAHIQLGVPGRHNIMNALAAVAAAHYMGISFADIETHIKLFRGAGRRFEIYGKYGGITIADDYAHHPTEINATLNAAKKLPHKKLWAIFQPFTFSRTVTWKNEFAQSLSNADHVILSPIMGSREDNITGIKSEDIASLIPGAVCFDKFEDIADYIINNADEDDYVITMGGGDIYKVAKILQSKLISA